MIRRGFINVGGRRVHYARAGGGPPVVMLHPSPSSGSFMRPAQQVFASRFTAIAFDTPGYGLSDPLPIAEPDMADFARALGETLDGLGLGQVALYGRHTGAAIAVEYSVQRPDRCSMVLCDGFPVFDRSQGAERIAHYMPPIQPSWEGAHLLWVWFRFRDQYVFWPWYEQDGAHRADLDLWDEPYLHAGAIDMLDAGNNYRLGYAAAFGYRSLDVLPDLTVPVCFGNRPGDTQYRSMKRYPPTAWTEEVPRERIAAAVAERSILERHPAAGPCPPAPAPAPLADRTMLDYVDFGDSQILVRRFGTGERPPVLLLHALPGSSALHDDLILAIGRHRPVIALDLPGHGQSVAPTGFETGIERWASAVPDMLDRLGIGKVHLYGASTGATVAVALATQAPARLLSLTLESPPVIPAREREALAASYAPEILPERDGTHLVRLWHHLRDQELWWPWFDGRRGAIRSGGHDIDPDRLTLRTRECMKQPENYRRTWQHVLRYPLIERLAGLRLPVQVIGADRDLFSAHLDAAAALTGRPALRTTPANRPQAYLDSLTDREPR